MKLRSKEMFRLTQKEQKISCNGKYNFISEIQWKIKYFFQQFRKNDQIIFKM